MLEDVLYCLFLFRRAILEHTQSVILTSLDFAILIGINSDADGMLWSRILVNQQNNSLDMARYDMKYVLSKGCSLFNDYPPKLEV